MLVWWAAVFWAQINNTIKIGLEYKVGIAFGESFVVPKSI